MLWKQTVIEFLEQRHLKKFSESLFEAWPKIARKDKLRVFKFLFNSGQWKNFVHFFLKELGEAQPVLPWDLLFSIMAQKSLGLPKKHQAFLKTLIQSKRVELSENPDHLEFVEALKTKEKYIFLADVQKRKQELIDSARIAKSERLFDQQSEYLNRLQKIFPGDMNVRQTLHSRQRTDAEQVLAKSRAQSRSLAPEKQQEKLENDAFAKNLAVQAQSVRPQTPYKNLDFAIMMGQMGYSRLGVSFLENFPDDERSSWFLFEFLLSSKQYLSLLSHCEIMKQRMSGRPEALFSISYFEALTYWELGEQKQAVEIMQYIAKTKPHFRSASELLSSWLEALN